MLRYFFAILFVLTVAVVAIAGFRGGTTTSRPIEIFPDMDHQPKYQPQHVSEFFADGRAARLPVPGTVPQGYTADSGHYRTGVSNERISERPVGFGASPDYLVTGKMEGGFGDGFPVEVTPALMERGRERYQISCAVCHGDSGHGDGVVQKFGMATVANLHQERLQTMADGEIFQTITEGKGLMGPYGGTVSVEDRWAIIAYMRALQRSQNGRIEDVPEQFRAELESQ